MTRLLIVILLILIFVLRVESLGGLNKVSTPVKEAGLLSYFASLNQQLDARINYSLPHPQADLMSGILIGTQKSLPLTLKTALKNTSTIHIAVVSGQNLSLLIGFVMSLVHFLGRKKTVFISLGVIIFYSLLTGLGIPVIRAAIMVSLALIAQLLGREKDAGWILFLTAMGMLIYEPSWLISISFQLSFLATLAVVVITPLVLPMVRLLPDLIKEDLVISLVVQLLTWPVVAINFHQVSLIGALANLFLLWTVSPIMIAGIAMLMGSLIGLDWLIGLVPLVLLTYFIYIVEFFNSLPLAKVTVPTLPNLLWIGYYLLLGGLFWLIYQINSSKTKLIVRVTREFPV